MPIDPSIPLSVKPPQFESPLQTIGQLMQLRDMGSQVALRNAQTQHALQQAEEQKAVTAQKNRELESNAALRDMMGNPDFAKMAGRADFSFMNGKADPAFIQKLTEGQQGLIKNGALTDAETIKNKLAVHQQAGKTLASLQLMSPEDRVSAYPGAVSELRKLPGAGAMQFPESISGTDQELTHLAAVNGALENYYESVAGLKNAQLAPVKTQAEIDEASGKAAQSQAEAKKLQTEEALRQRALQVKPEDFHARADLVVPQSSVIDGKTYDTSDLNKSVHSAIDAALRLGKPEDADKAIQKGSDDIESTRKSVRTSAANVGNKVTVIEAGQAVRNAAAAPSDAGLDLMAEGVLSGQPLMGVSRNPVIQAKVATRAAEIAGQRGMTATQALMARNAAQASKGALNSVTKAYETLKPFGEMAEKNADILERESKKVDSLGGSFFNTPLRDLESKFGSTKVAAFRAALQPVQADFARILNSPTGGGVLSDSARHEMQASLGDGATPGQIKAALDIFRQDWANRKATYDDAVTHLQGQSVVGGSGQSLSMAPSSLPGGHKVGDSVKLKGGKTGKISAIHPDGTFDATDEKGNKLVP